MTAELGGPLLLLQACTELHAGSGRGWRAAVVGLRLVLDVQSAEGRPRSASTATPPARTPRTPVGGGPSRTARLTFAAPVTLLICGDYR